MRELRGSHDKRLLGVAGGTLARLNRSQPNKRRT